jgi:hypothetical protein
MGHANIDVTQNVYGRRWWEERVEAVTGTVAAVFPQDWSPHWSPPDSGFCLSDCKDWSGREDSNLRPPSPELQKSNSKCLIWCRLGVQEGLSFSALQTYRSCTEMKSST